MRAVIQRVSSASVKINGILKDEIKLGLLILLGIEENDNQEDIEWLVSKILNMRLFADQDNKMNLDLTDIGGELMVVSQFTLYASTKKGNRPSFVKSARPDIAEKIYRDFIKAIEKRHGKIHTGTFGAMMDVSLINSGPVTILIDSKNRE